MTPAPLADLGSALRKALLPFHRQDADARARAQQHVVSAMSRAQREEPRARRTWAWTAAPALAAALGVTLLWSRLAHEPLEFSIESHQGAVNDWITGHDAAQALRFSDGTVVTVGAEATARVVALSEHGARLTLERGALEAEVVHREAASWQVAAGPYLVRVTGTHFSVAWNPQGEELNVRVTHGSVEVSGGGNPTRVLGAGASLTLRPEREPRAVASATPATPRTPEPMASTANEPAPHRSTEPRPDWRELAAGGRYRDALELVEQQGFAAQCGALSAGDLLTLGSAARLAARSDRASEAYLAVRRRFPAAPEAALAAFSLGRLTSDSGRDPVAATRWFETYLAEQPGGQLAREASGRVLELESKTNDAGRARAAARRYLERYPTGPHAALARSILAAQ